MDRLFYTLGRQEELNFLLSFTLKFSLDLCNSWPPLFQAAVHTGAAREAQLPAVRGGTSGAGRSGCAGRYGAVPGGNDKRWAEEAGRLQPGQPPRRVGCGGRHNGAVCPQVSLSL